MNALIDSCVDSPTNFPINLLTNPLTDRPTNDKAAQALQVALLSEDAPLNHTVGTLLGQYDRLENDVSEIKAELVKNREQGRGAGVILKEN